MPTNLEIFQSTLAENYSDLFQNDPEYSYSASRNTPEQLSEKMVASLKTKSANIEGKGIRRTCSKLKIPYNIKAIAAYLNS